MRYNVIMSLKFVVWADHDSVAIHLAQDGLLDYLELNKKYPRDIIADCVWTAIEDPEGVDG